MSRRWNVFALGRMRHLDLLALWHRLHPDSSKRDQALVGGMSKENLVAAIVGGAPAPPRT